MMYLCKEQAKTKNEALTSYAPIARSRLSSLMDPADREQIKNKIEISFVMAKEHNHS